MTKSRLENATRGELSKVSVLVEASAAAKLELRDLLGYEFPRSEFLSVRVTNFVYTIFVPIFPRLIYCLYEFRLIPQMFYYWF